MKLDVTAYSGRKFDWHKYNCCDFAADYWRDLTGQDLRDGFDMSIRGDGNNRHDLIKATRKLIIHVFHDTLTEVPPLMSMLPELTIGRFEGRFIPLHVGVCSEGMIAHLEKSGKPTVQPIDTISSDYTKIQFYR